ncbi:MAG TPA: tripartite tricarboxylate transporter substrate binding protein [Bordetella sp.]|jgi:putative tricarboxylic transport membrane protein|nr:tripartite tricarboxylate transporter substrate binding protein [Bordetella sp.]
MKRMLLRMAFMALAGSLFGTAAQAEGWTPSGSVELVVAAGPGGGNDRTARLLAKVLTEGGYVKAPIVVINKPGAGGVIAQNYLNSHRGSGNYLMITNPALITNPLSGIGTAKYTEVTPVAQLFNEYVVLFTKTGSAIKSGADALAALKRDPGSLTLAVAPGLGAGPHIAAAMVAQAAGVDPAKLRVVPYATAGEAITALLGGHVDLMASTPLNVLPQLTAGAVQALGITSPTRLRGPLASVPTWKEQGTDVVFGNWRGVVGPSGMTPEQRTYWNQVFAKMVAAPAWQKEIDDELAQDDYRDAAASKAFLDQENARLAAILKQLGLAKSQ